MRQTDMRPMDMRRYDLDWLRVIAFGLLILYHCGMFFVSWGWHVKSTLAGPGGGAIFEPAMLLLNPWRLPLLFLISGVALRFAVDKAPHRGRFAGRRAWRLFLPLLIGTLIIVAPQSFLQLTESGEISSSFLAFYPGYLSDIYSITTPTWNHLWYLAYILVYSMILIPMARPLAALSKWFGGPALIATFIGVHLVIRFTLDPVFPTTHDLTGDWANHAHSAAWFVTGFVLAKADRAWDFIARFWVAGAALVLTLAVLLSFAWAQWETVQTLPDLLLFARIGRVGFTGLVIFALLGAAQRFLNRPSARLTWLGGSVFAWYIFHQTVTIMAGYWVTRQGLSLAAEVMAVIGLTIIGTGLLTEIARRSGPLRPAFGFAPQRKDSAQKPANARRHPLHTSLPFPGRGVG